MVEAMDVSSKIYIYYCETQLWDYGGVLARDVNLGNGTQKPLFSEPNESRLELTLEFLIEIVFWRISGMRDLLASSKR